MTTADDVRHPTSGDSMTAATREPALDVLRGLAIVWMMAFHLAYDLNHFGWLEPRQQFLSDPFWTWQRVCIVSLFMFCAGVSQSMARTQAIRWGRFWRRWLQVAGCAALVSLATWWVFPASWIFFGVLHGLALMVLVARLTAAWPTWVLAALGLCAIGLPWWAAHPVFDHPSLQFLGLVTRKPITEDYAPLLPWMGLVWWGLAAGPWLRRYWARRPVAEAVPTGGAALGVWLRRGLATLGRWPLTAYMVHQPVFWGILLGLQG